MTGVVGTAAHLRAIRQAHVAVVGGGIMGAMTAAHLVELGTEVTLYDPHPRARSQEVHPNLPQCVNSCDDNELESTHVSRQSIPKEIRIYAFRFKFVKLM